MNNVVNLENVVFEKAKAVVLENLKGIHHGKPVNMYCATSGLRDFSLGLRALKALVAERAVKVETFTNKDPLGRIHRASLYRYNGFSGL